jgi:hypothetical protein
MPGQERVSQLHPCFVLLLELGPNYQQSVCTCRVGTYVPIKLVLVP